MISYPNGGLNQISGRLRGMRQVELTPNRVILPRRIRTEHRVHGARELPRRGHPRRGPADPRLKRFIILREPAVRRVLYVRDDAAHERAAQPAIGPGRNRPPDCLDVGTKPA